MGAAKSTQNDEELHQRTIELAYGEDTDLWTNLESDRSITATKRLHYLICNDEFSWNHLHTTAQFNQLALADLIIKSVDISYRERVVFCVNNNGRTPLHYCSSSEMVELLVTSLPPHVRQNYLLHPDIDACTAAHCAISLNRHDTLSSIWSLSNDTTREQLLSYRGVCEVSLLMEAGHCGNRETVCLVLNLYTDSDCWEETIMSASGRGETIRHPLVAHQWMEELAEILKTLTLEQRRRLLSLKNFWGYSPYQLALMAPHQISPNSQSDRRTYVTMWPSLQRLKITDP